MRQSCQKISSNMMKFKFGWLILFLSINAPTAWTVSADTEMDGIQSGCKSDEFINPDTSSCTSCELLCSNSQNRRVCGTACEDYFRAKALEEWKNQQNLKSQENSKTSKAAKETSGTANTMAKWALIIAIVALVLCFLVIGLVVYLLFGKRNGHSIISYPTGDMNKNYQGSVQISTELDVERQP